MVPMFSVMVFLGTEKLDLRAACSQARRTSGCDANAPVAPVAEALMTWPRGLTVTLTVTVPDHLLLGTGLAQCSRV